MYSLFNMDLNIQNALYRDPNWVYVSDTVGRGLASFIEYYHHADFVVASNHLLVKLLQSVSASKEMDPVEYVDRVAATQFNLSMAFKFTSYLNKGELFRNVFYGPNSNEIIVATDEPFDVKEAYTHWKDVEALKVLRHDRSNLSLEPLDGKKKYGSEVSVVSINIALLALQYKAFRDNEHLESNGDSERSLMHFVHKYVLTNMIPSHLDWALFNRAYNQLFHIESDPFTQRTPFYQIDYTSKIDSIINLAITRIRSTKIRFEGILKIIPALSTTNLFELAKLPTYLPTRQITWALVVSRLKVLEFLFQASDLSDTTENQNEMNKILRAAIYYRSANTLSYGLPMHLFLDVSNRIEHLEAIAQIGH